MADPDVVSTANTAGAGGTVYNVTLPAGITPKRLLVAIVGADTDSAATASGWTKPANGWGSNGTQGNTVWLREATGSDALAHTGANKARFAICYCVAGWTGNLNDIVVATGTTNSVDPPAVSLSGTARPIRIITATRNDNASITGAPTNYTLVPVNDYGAAHLGSAHRALTGTGDNPGPFTVSSTAGAHAVTIGIPFGSYDRPSPGAFLPFF